MNIEEALTYLIEERDLTLKELDIWDTEEMKKDSLKYVEVLDVVIQALSKPQESEGD